jgi:3-carboxy-cis,cis-muconate cycloisomerase
LPTDRFFGPTYTTDAMEAATSDVAWLQAMLDVEAALARAEAQTGVIPAAAADAIAACCEAGRFDVARLGRDTVPAGNPVIPMVRALTRQVPEDAARYVHWGATSQDVLDSAMMLVARRGLELLTADVDIVASDCAGLARRHRDALMPGRTILQQALPITFGLKAAGWLAAVLDARRRLTEFERRGLAIQFGGAAGTLASLGERGLDVSRALAEQLDLPEPPLPWHTARGRVAELAGVLGRLAGTVGKLALDIALMAQTEVGEVAESGGPGRGGSSTLPHKRNPVASMAVRACVRGVNAQVSLLFGAMAHEHERAAGAWQAEWPAVGEALRLTAGAVARTHEMLDGLEVDAERMRRNVAMTRGLLVTEHVMMVLAERIGRLPAHDIVEEASARVATGGEDLREVLSADPRVSGPLSAAEIDAALDPAGYLGSAQAFIDRALAEYTKELGAEVS